MTEPDGICGVPAFDPPVTATTHLLRCSIEVGIKRVMMMAKNTTPRSASARKSLSRARPESARARPEKKKVRRTIFKTDQWYENAAMSIGIAGRPKGPRPGTAIIARAKDRAD
jgi:hypothetical protein